MQANWETMPEHHHEFVGSRPPPPRAVTCTAKAQTDFAAGTRVRVTANPTTPTARVEDPLPMVYNIVAAKNMEQLAIWHHTFCCFKRQSVSSRV